MRIFAVIASLILLITSYSVEANAQTLYASLQKKASDIMSCVMRRVNKSEQPPYTHIVNITIDSVDEDKNSGIYTINGTAFRNDTSNLGFLAHALWSGEDNIMKPWYTLLESKEWAFSIDVKKVLDAMVARRIFVRKLYYNGEVFDECNE